MLTSQSTSVSLLLHASFVINCWNQWKTLCPGGYMSTVSYVIDEVNLLGARAPMPIYVIFGAILILI